MEIEYPRDALSRLLDTREGPQSEHDVWLEIVDMVFFASMLRDEGHVVRFGVVYHPHGVDGLEQIKNTYDASGPAWRVTKLIEQKLSTNLLAKLARAIDFGNELIVIGGQASNLKACGIARLASYSDGGAVPIITAPRPGTLVVDYDGEEKWRFENGFTELEPINVLRQEGQVRDALAKIGLLETEEDLISRNLDWFITRLLRNMSATGAGGLLTILPEPLTDKMPLRIDYRLSDPHLLMRQIEACQKSDRELFVVGPEDRVSSDTELAALFKKRTEREDLTVEVEETLAMLGRLSVIDGALLMGPNFATYGAGHIVDNVVGCKALRALDAKARLGGVEESRHGARHQAALSFAWTHPGGVAFVISKDGPALCATRVRDHVYYWRLNIAGA